MVRTMKKTVYHTKLTTKRRVRGIANGVVTGLASLLTISTPHQPTMRAKVENSNKALRGDFVRIGMDMRKAAAEVMQREKTTR